MTATFAERHPGLTGAKLHVVDAIHRDLGWVTTAYVAEATGYSPPYTARLLAELADEGVVERAVDGTPCTGRGKRPSIWSCCGS